MKRQPYFPTRQSDEPEWFGNFGGKLTPYATTLGMDAPRTVDIIKDAKFCGYSVGSWLVQGRAFGAACTAALEELYTGSLTGAYVLPAFIPPALPAGVVPVPAGALNRIFKYIADFKNKEGYLPSMGEDLRIVGVESVTPALPEFTLRVLTGNGCECVQVRFKKFGRLGVVVECRRGNGPWEMLGIDTDSPYTDERPLLSPTVPEVREYRLRFWDGTPTGDYTPVQRVTVAPV